jgi:hypothetical protein
LTKEVIYSHSIKDNVSGCKSNAIITFDNECYDVELNDFIEVKLIENMIVFTLSNKNVIVYNLSNIRKISISKVE